MTDYLQRLARRAVQAPALVPRIASRFERDVVPGTHALEVDDWTETSAPAAAPAPPPRAEHVSMPTPRSADTPVDTTPAAEARPRDARVAPMPTPPDPTRAPSLAIDLAPLRAAEAAVSAMPETSPSPHRARASSIDRDAAVEPRADTTQRATPHAGDEPAIALARIERVDADADAVAAPSMPAAPPHRTHMPAAHLAPTPAAVPSRAAPAALQVEINIDRIEVRGLAPATPPPPAPTPAARLQPMSLDEHLRRRRGEPA